MATKFRKKPVVIEARQLTKDADWDAIAAWCGGKIYNVDLVPGAEPVSRMSLKTLESDGERQVADQDDWIIRGVKNEFYPCKPDIFAATYEPVEE